MSLVIRVIVVAACMGMVASQVKVHRLLCCVHHCVMHVWAVGMRPSAGDPSASLHAILAVCRCPLQARWSCP